MLQNVTTVICSTPV